MSCCLSCLDTFFGCSFVIEEEEDDDDESLEAQDFSTFWSVREASKKQEASYEKVGQDVIDSQFDPDEEYVRKYETLGWHTDKAGASEGVSGIEELGLEAERALSCASSENLTPREIKTKLNQFDTCIRVTKDLEKKRSYIQRYEIHKYEHDEDNADDKEKADFYLSNARDEQRKNVDRLEYYQIAIKFTNNVSAKQSIKDEYRRFAYSLSPRSQ